MSLWHCEKCNTYYGLNPYCTDCGRIGSRVEADYSNMAYCPTCFHIFEGVMTSSCPTCGKPLSRFNVSDADKLQSQLTAIRAELKELAEMVKDLKSV